jgi:hypothetical protein
MGRGYAGDNTKELTGLVVVNFTKDTVGIEGTENGSCVGVSALRAELIVPTERACFLRCH